MKCRVGFMFAFFCVVGCGQSTGVSNLFYKSGASDFAPVQIAASGLPDGIGQVTWVRPTVETRHVPFWGQAGQPAGHEGVDYVNDSAGSVPVRAAAAGKVVYFQIGCPQDSEFSHNNTSRECGSGWGNHVVLDHGNGIFTRYAHLKPGSITIELNQKVGAGESIALMGNSGRSELRHLHFELGKGVIHYNDFDNEKPPRSFAKVYDADKIPYGVSSGFLCKSQEHNMTSYKYVLTSSLKLEVYEKTGSLMSTLDAKNKNDYAAKLNGRNVLLKYDARSSKDNGLFIYRLVSDGKIYLKHDGQGDGIPMICR